MSIRAPHAAPGVTRDQILRYLLGLDPRHWPVSTRQIGMAVGLTSPATVHRHLLILEAEGLVERGRMGFRAVRA